MQAKGRRWFGRERREGKEERRKEGGKPDGDVQGWLGPVTQLRVQESLSRIHIKSQESFSRRRAAERRSDKRVSRETESRGFLHAISRKYHRNNQGCGGNLFQLNQNIKLLPQSEM